LVEKKDERAAKPHGRAAAPESTSSWTGGDGVNGIDAIARRGTSKPVLVYECG
jgi:hypothetical protein